ncbi:MAG: hypothetical protein PHI85_00030 [Victivallaceae bacterium]|nr:hypothetical protein [Victivallaceae bacterium]
MIKLSASLILAGRGKVVAHNGNGDTAANRNGAITCVSNMTGSAIAVNGLKFTDAVQVGQTSNRDVMMVKASYNNSIYIPVLGQSVDIRAGEYGICASDNCAYSLTSAIANESQTKGITLKRLKGGRFVVFNLNGGNMKILKSELFGALKVLGKCGDLVKITENCLPNTTFVS